MCEVLVVDDDFMVARAHTAVVEGTPGFRVVGVAHTAAEALEAIETLRPDLVLLDIYLPDLTGLEVIRRTRASGSPTDFLALTAAAEADVVAAAMQGGVVGYLLKPFRLEELRERLTSFQERRRLLETGGAIDQSLVDRAMSTASGSAGRPAAPLPKGMSAETAELIASVLSTRSDDISTSECATLLGLSRVSVRRYLEHFVTTGEATVRLRYGQAGRPQRRYLWSAGPDAG